jgi:hypothetical protein
MPLWLLFPAKLYIECCAWIVHNPQKVFWIWPLTVLVAWVL